MSSCLLRTQETNNVGPSTEVGPDGGMVVADATSMATTAQGNASSEDIAAAARMHAAGQTPAPFMMAPNNDSLNNDSTNNDRASVIQQGEVMARPEAHSTPQHVPLNDGVSLVTMPMPSPLAQTTMTNTFLVAAPSCTTQPRSGVRRVEEFGVRTMPHARGRIVPLMARGRGRGRGTSPIMTGHMPLSPQPTLAEQFPMLRQLSQPHNVVMHQQPPPQFQMTPAWSADSLGAPNNVHASSTSGYATPAPAQFAQQPRQMQQSQQIPQPQQNEQMRCAEMIMTSNMSTADKLAILAALQPSFNNEAVSGVQVGASSHNGTTAHSGSMRTAVQGVRDNNKLSDNEIERKFCRSSTTAFNSAFTKKDGKAVSFNGSVGQHPVFMKQMQNAFDYILGMYVPEELAQNYGFRDAPGYIKMKMYPYVMRCATSTAEPWADLAKKQRPINADGSLGIYDNLFDQCIAYLDGRFDDKNMHKQGEKQLLADVQKVKHQDGQRTLPHDVRVEFFFSVLFNKLRDYAEVKSVTVTEAYKEQTMHDHAFEQMPRFMEQRVAALVKPTDVEEAIEVMRSTLRIQHNFAKAKDMPLSDKEVATGSRGNSLVEPSKQHAFTRANDKGKVGRRRRPHLNVDLSKKTLKRGECWHCSSKSHNMYECAQAKAEADANTRSGKSFDDVNREAVTKFKEKNDWQDLAHEQGFTATPKCAGIAGWTATMESHAVKLPKPRLRMLLCKRPQ